MASHKLPSAGRARRRFLAGCASAGLLVSVPALAHVREKGARTLTFHQLHTGEKCRTTYWENGHYLDDGLAEINRLLRDHRTNEVHVIDPELLDQLVRLQEVLEHRKELRVVSGYRSPKTNAKLRARSKGVAKHSLHMDGRAIDIRVPGRSTRQVQQAALDLRAGGVGYYPKSRFVHLDTGRVRSW